MLNVMLRMSCPQEIDSAAVHDRSCDVPRRRHEHRGEGTAGDAAGGAHPGDSAALDFPRRRHCIPHWISLHHRQTRIS